MTDPSGAHASVRVEVDGAVGRLTLAAPERLNAVAPDMLRAVATGVQQLDADPTVRVVVLSGVGRSVGFPPVLGLPASVGLPASPD